MSPRTSAFTPSVSPSIDATRKSNYPDEIAVPGFEAINMADFIPGYRNS